jgi:uncharacterized protein
MRPPLGDQIEAGVRLNSIRGDFLQLIILPTEKCNLRCRYCYEDFVQGNMSGDTISGIKKILESRMNSLRHLQIGWFGGEPLLNLRAINDICGFVIKNSPSSLNFRSSISTNATLLNPQKLEELAKLNVLDYQITLDGDQESHDSTRVTRSGKGTFSTIWNSLVGFKGLDADFNVRLRIHLTKHNTNSQIKLLKKIADEFGGDPRWSVHIKKIEKLNTNFSAKSLLLDDANIVETITDYAKSLGLTIAAAEDHICYAAKPNSFVIRANGVVSKCTVAFDDPNNNIGKINKSGLSIDNEKYAQWIQPVLDNNLKDAICPLHAINRNKASKIIIRES